MDLNQTTNQRGSMVVWVIVGVVILVVIFAIWRGVANNPETTPAPSSSVIITPDVSLAPTPTPTPTPSAANEVKTFIVKGSSFAYAPATIKVKKGDTVKIIFQNTGGLHDWVIDEFNARTAKINSGETDEVMFVASKTGNFEYYCSVGNHRAMGMKGILTVE